MSPEFKQAFIKGAGYTTGFLAVVFAATLIGYALGVRSETAAVLVSRRG